MMQVIPWESYTWRSHVTVSEERVVAARKALAEAEENLRRVKKELDLANELGIADAPLPLNYGKALVRGGRQPVIPVPEEGQVAEIQILPVAGFWSVGLNPSNRAKAMDVLEALQIAIDHVKKAGFEFHHVPLKPKNEDLEVSPTVYFHWPGEMGLLRLSCHKKSKAPFGALHPVWASLTIAVDKGARLPGQTRLKPEKIRSGVACAIGNYFLNRVEDPERVAKWEANHSK